MRCVLTPGAVGRQKEGFRPEEGLSSAPRQGSKCMELCRLKQGSVRQHVATGLLGAQSHREVGVEVSVQQFHIKESTADLIVFPFVLGVYV